MLSTCAVDYNYNQLKQDDANPFATDEDDEKS